jgi:hypothetical protein
MTKRTAEFADAVVATICLVWWQNRQCSLPQEGSGYVPANFQAKKTKIIAPGPVSVEGRRNGLRRHLIGRLLMVAKASRRFVSLLICRIWLRRTFFSFREVKSKPANLSLSQGSLKTNLEGVAQASSETGPPSPFGGRWTTANDSPNRH